MSFVSNVKTMLGGFALAQIIPLLAVPVLTRLYTPEAFGLQLLFMGVVAVLVIACTLRLDLALQLAADEKEGGLLISLISLLTLIVLMVLIAGIVIFGEPISAKLGHSGQSMWMWFALPMTAATVFMQVATSLLTRQKRFGPIARTNVYNQVGYVAFAFSAGPFLGALGLVAAKLAGQLVGISLVLRYVASNIYRYFRIPTPDDVRVLWNRFHQFVVFNAPYSLIGTAARDMPIYVFSTTGAAAAAGFYGLSRTVLSVPMLLATAGLSQVFYREAIEYRGAMRIETTARALLRLTLCGLAPLFVFVCVWGDVVFVVLFGTKWLEAGIYAMILAPAAWLSVQTSWPERLFEVAGRQEVSFKVQMTFDMLTAIVVILPLMAGENPIISVIGFAVVNCVYHLVYLTAIFSVSGFSKWHLQRLLFEGMATLLLSCSVFALVRNFLIPGLAGAVVCAFVAVAISVVLVLKSARDVGALLGKEETT
ncbi:lipopolysaccharide biosynthesis protein [Mesorhizobium sp. UC22_110]|jgi:O-antigen/teichoic acid export membrane protein|uniref:lipopolysaccharide biosynthesis protein n=1 Tax=unclassified Mesorhizobium TaxID=325217 RepID=UPI00366C3AC2